MEEIDYSECLYSILECYPTATQDEIKKSYQSLALKHHPDKQMGKHSDTFLRIDRAWKVLRDPDLRREYDAVAGQREFNDVPIVNESLEKEELDFNTEDQIYEKSCRCGGSYSIDKEEMDSMDTNFYLNCSECSLVIEILINR